ncbi:MarR family winged helix-turn-helix transcriptional regulator [Paenibacillus sp. IHBB 10380]|uniref:MarR family winged helix-turn-helix transcriptional regulator n=1 Tax=Paenibacillus sp. IHBB 10380 TaxID=1566358 RepID=UPI0005CFB879|nr:MarR family winged helix-turn-helix transcriptional regulator [Paenibacillus sp. IHBB 10380]AJS58309.1 MarR family transcriptional regulator [Paenibacillus sp. IHBB 10380]
MNNKIALLNQYWTDIYYYLHYPHEEIVTHQIIRILQLVDKQVDVGINEVAASLKVTHNTASEHVKRIIEKNYLFKKRDTFDERKVILCLTDMGKEALHRNTCLDEQKLASILNELSANEKEIVVNGLKILSERVKQCL